MNTSDIVASIRSLLDKLEPARVQDQSGPPAAVTDMTSAMMGSAPATPERDANLTREQAERDAQFWDGAFVATKLLVPDLAYLAHMAEPYGRRTGRDIMRDGIVSGTNRDLALARNIGEYARNNYPAADYSGPLRVIVEGRMA